MVTEVDVNRWLLRAVENPKMLPRDEITVTEVATPCLRKSYYVRTRGPFPSPSEFLKTIGNNVHVVLQEVLESQGCETEVSVSIQLDGFKLRGRVDAICREWDEDVVLEFKAVNEIPKEPYTTHELQVQAYLLMLKLEKGYLIYLSRTNGRVKVYKVKKDKAALKTLIERAKQLHESLVELRPPPAERGVWCNTCPFVLACKR